jgi:hypothetical protein
MSEMDEASMAKFEAECSKKSDELKFKAFKGQLEAWSKEREAGKKTAEGDAAGMELWYRGTLGFRDEEYKAKAKEELARRCVARALGLK